MGLWSEFRLLVADQLLYAATMVAPKSDTVGTLLVKKAVDYYAESAVLGLEKLREKMMNGYDGSKYVGMDADEAVRQIRALGLFESVNKVSLDSLVTADYRLDRVRVYHDRDNRVTGADVG